jgi:hypothetical protein
MRAGDPRSNVHKLAQAGEGAGGPYYVLASLRMISPNGIAHIQLTARVAAIFALALGIMSCDRDTRNDAPSRAPYTASASTVQVSNVELAIEPCSLPQQCDFFYRISNRSDRCIAFSEIDLPRGGHVWLDATLRGASRRMTGYPVDRVRYTFVVLQPGDTFREGVDLQAIVGSHDLSNSNITFATGFFECATFAGAPGNSFELVSAPITFAVGAPPLSSTLDPSPP